APTSWIGGQIPIACSGIRGDGLDSNFGRRDRFPRDRRDLGIVESPTEGGHVVGMEGLEIWKQSPIGACIHRPGSGVHSSGLSSSTWGAPLLRGLWPASSNRQRGRAKQL